MPAPPEWFLGDRVPAPSARRTASSPGSLTGQWDVTRPSPAPASLCSVAQHIWLCGTPRTLARQAPPSMGTLQASILEWVAMPSSRGSSPQPGNRTHASHVAGRSFTVWVTAFLVNKHITMFTRPSGCFPAAPPPTPSNNVNTTGCYSHVSQQGNWGPKRSSRRPGTSDQWEAVPDSRPGLEAPRDFPLIHLLTRTLLLVWTSFEGEVLGHCSHVHPMSLELFSALRTQRRTKCI